MNYCAGPHLGVSPMLWQSKQWIFSLRLCNCMIFTRCSQLTLKYRLNLCTDFGSEMSYAKFNVYPRQKSSIIDVCLRLLKKKYCCAAFAAWFLYLKFSKEFAVFAACLLVQYKCTSLFCFTRSLYFGNTKYSLVNLASGLILRASSQESSWFTTDLRKIQRWYQTEEAENCCEDHA